MEATKINPKYLLEYEELISPLRAEIEKRAKFISMLVRLLKDLPRKV